MKLSIITINYNNASGLEKTIKSVIAQTFKDFEYLIVDGDSRDNSVQIIETLLKNSDCTFSFVSEPDDGIYNAMNKGIKKAKGEYCLFLNSGDELISGSVLNDVFNVMQQPTADILIGNELRDNHIIKTKFPVTFFDLYSSSLPHQSTFIRRELFYRVGFYNENFKIVSDWEFWLKSIIIFNCSVIKIDFLIANYNITGISNSEIELRTKERGIVLAELFPKMVIADYYTFEKHRKLFLYANALINHPKVYKILMFVVKIMYKLNMILLRNNE
ncbi:MAG: glycosyltransferase family 2 protein [Paludibacter sp.]|nr:glycosyltransferase family 2 protein [Paludibacter sp.]